MDHFIRISNVAVRTFDTPIKWSHRPKRHALVSETAFYLWSDFQAGDRPNLARAESRARGRLAQVANQLELPGSLDQTEVTMAMRLAHRMAQYAEGFLVPGSVEIERRLPGIGWISGGLPDITAQARSVGIVLSEVKAVDRPFRSVDMRQMVVYAVLYFAQHRRLPACLSVVNPLKGAAIEVGTDEFFADVVGLPADEVINHLLIEWSAAGVSP
ncbi:hypothetical protein ACFQO7_26590 [Catellatospora aurea]|uniref:PD-(D/E)XK endonuclease-like domain-containing protein n=1 Tax=Catellatospora aurea TaxID=1337874 RepID=A0ABW2H1D0_9ACTN